MLDTLRRRGWVVVVLALCFGALMTVHAQPPSTVPPNGLRDNTPDVHALVNARIITSAGKTIEKGTIVLRDGVITAVGNAADVQVAADARRWDCSGKTIYPGLIDACSDLPSDASKTVSRKWVRRQIRRQIRGLVRGLPRG